MGKLTGIVLLAILTSVSAFASQPGQPMDCSDWVLLDPRLNCHVATGPGQLPDLFRWKGSNLAIDNEGFPYAVRQLDYAPGRGRIRVELYRLRNSQQELVGYVETRVRWDGSSDYIYDQISASWTDINGNQGVAVGQVVTFDPANGRLLIPLTSRCASNAGGCPDPAYSAGLGWLAAIDGLAPLYEVRQSYSASTSAFRITVPAMPEALPAAERLDTYWGSLSTPLNLAAAQPLQCAYPDHQPAPGEYLQITAPVPTPAPGHANYVLTSVTYQGQTRAGRKAENGRLSGRDASQLPECVIASEERGGR